MGSRNNVIGLWAFFSGVAGSTDKLSKRGKSAVKTAIAASTRRRTASTSSLETPIAKGRDGQPDIDETFVNDLISLMKRQLDVMEQFLRR